MLFLEMHINQKSMINLIGYYESGCKSFPKKEEEEVKFENIR